MLRIKLGLILLVESRGKSGTAKRLLALVLRETIGMLPVTGTGTVETWMLLSGIVPLSAADTDLCSTDLLSLN
jgi:hypothetical protein